MRFKLFLLTTPIVFSICQSSFSQVTLPGTFDFEYYRLLLSKNDFEKEPIASFPSIITDHSPDSSLTFNPWGSYAIFPATSPKKFNLISPTIGTIYNTGMGRSYNDGSMWNGKGGNAYFKAGFYGQIKVSKKSYLSYTFSPVVFYSQNKYTPIPDQEFDKSPYSYPFLERLDYVERYGNSGFASVNAGQSEVKYVYGQFAAGATSQNYSWGPAVFNPILMSQQAAGFPQVNLGTNAPVDIKIGRLEGKVIWGVLAESDYYDDDPNNNRRYITGFTGGYRPSFIKGLNIGLHRIMYREWEGMDVKDAFSAFLNTSPVYDEQLGEYVTNDVYDQMASISIRWNRPELGLEMYTEYARNDFPGNLKEFLRNPDRSRAITIGVSEAFEINNGSTIKLLYENTTLSANQLQMFNVFSSPTYYVHNILKHGYTHDGQYIGAGIGAGSNTHIMQAQYFNQNGMFGVSAQRIRFNDDYILRQYAGALTYPSEFELAYTATVQRFLNNFSIAGQATYSTRYQWFFGEQGSLRNFQFQLSARYFIISKS